ncbi:MAG: GNAT family N-acetyltransferase [Thermoplasmatota archaeon]
MEWDASLLSFEKVGDRKEIRQRMVDHYREVGFQGEAYIQEKMDFSSLYHILSRGEKIGLFAKHRDGSLVNLIIDPSHRSHDSEIFDTVRRRYRIRRAEVPGFDLHYLGPAALKARKTNVLGWYFSDGMDVEPEPPKEGLLWKRVMKNDKDRVKEASGDFFNPIDYALDACELYYVLDGEDMKGIGILAEHYYTENAASCGMYVSENCRRSGYGRYIISTLKRMAVDRGLVPVAGCAVDNIGSRRTLEGAGFMVKAPHFELLY